MLTVYGRRNSSNCAKVFWLLEEIDRPFDLVPMGRGSGAENPEELARLTPFGKVPVIRDGDFVTWESNAILRFLASGASCGELWPEDAPGRARIDRWMDWASLSLTPPLTRLRKARQAGGEGDLGPVVEAFRHLDGQLGRSAYLAADVLTLADIAAAPAIHRWGLLAVADSDSLPDLPHLAAYRSRLKAYEPYRRHIEDALS
ncbi:glutathione S-transferase family protein [Martelella soudanensis]|uniref:glutathione S-transferase family protein n=1 Tax=unclassified Martelella TaxID=2629616 RepID=UPI0015DDEFA4|nr:MULTISPECIES: glutathione S-transferase family protein [unclassified Martelella]